MRFFPIFTYSSEYLNWLIILSFICFIFDIISEDLVHWLHQYSQPLLPLLRLFCFGENMVPLMVTSWLLHSSACLLLYFYIVLGAYVFSSMTINKSFMAWLKVNSIGWKSIYVLILVILWIIFTAQWSIKIWFVEGFFSGVSFELLLS